MKLTELNIDCIETNFEYLELGDLLNAADSNVRLRKATNYVFVRRYQNKKVLFQSMLISKNRLITIDEDHIIINDLKSSLQLLRCFGQLIREIHVNCNQHNYRWLYKYVLIYIQKYCDNSLTALFIKGYKFGYLKILKKPFPLLETLSVSDCVMKIKKDWIKRLFPSVKVLKIICPRLGRSFECPYFAYNFPKLENYEIYILSLYRLENFTTMFRLNPQLKVLKISSASYLENINANLFQNVIENFQNLEILIISTKINFINDYNNDIIFFSNVKQFDISVFPLPTYGPLQLPFVFSKLESFSICCAFNLIDEPFYSFIDKHPTIKKLQLKHFHRSVPLSNLKSLIERLERSLSSLEIVEFEYYILSLDQVLSFIRKFKSLKILSFPHSADYAIEELQNCLDIWSLTKTNHPRTTIITIQLRN